MLSDAYKARFWSKVARTEDPSLCWEWTAARTGNGYGNFKAPWGHEPAHRIAIWIATDKFPDSLVVRHKCDNPICCNPVHLEFGSQGDNIQDQYDRGRRRLATQEVTP